jgi:hypothetical protein
MARLIGVLFLFSGAALIANISTSVPLPLTLGVAVIVSSALVFASVRRLSAPARTVLAGRVRAGAVAGIPALVLYDVSKQLLAQLDPSPYNPFEAIRLFGELLVGGAAHPVVIVLAGVSFHAMNGLLFAVAFAVLFLRASWSVGRALLLGTAWGLFLEAFQLALYPSWLGIRLVAEFATISALAHVVYGSTLGLVARALLLRSASHRGDHERT